MIPKITVITDPDRVGMGVQVFINGFKVPGLINVEVRTPVHEAPTATLTLVGFIETKTFEKEEPNANPEP